MSLYPRPYTYLYKIEIKWIRYSGWDKPPNPTKARYLIATSLKKAEEMAADLISRNDLTEREMEVTQICNVNELEKRLDESYKVDDYYLSRIRQLESENKTLKEKEIQAPISYQRPKRSWLSLFERVV
jgi:hypothetical protein